MLRMTFLSGLATKTAAFSIWLVTGHHAKSAAVIWPTNGAFARFFETPNDTAGSGRSGCASERTALARWFSLLKCGVMITELMPETIRQPALWGELAREKRERGKRTVCAVWVSMCRS